MKRDFPRFKTADFSDKYPESRVVLLPFRNFGRPAAFGGPVITARISDEFGHLLSLIEEAGQGRVLVIDANGHRECAVLGDRMAARAAKNGWAGMVINGMVRDAAELAEIDLGVMALGTVPRRGSLAVASEDIGTAVTFGGVTIHTGDHAYCDIDGVLISEVDLTAQRVPAGSA